MGSFCHPPGDCVARGDLKRSAAPLLPPSWMTLYELTKVPDGVAAVPFFGSAVT